MAYAAMLKRDENSGKYACFDFLSKANIMLANIHEFLNRIS